MIEEVIGIIVYSLNIMTSYIKLTPDPNKAYYILHPQPHRNFILFC